jgi:hypothetical protein
MPMPISVNAVGKPSMIATTTRPSISRPMWPLVMTGALSSMVAAPAISSAIRPKPNQSSLRIVMDGLFFPVSAGRVM